jgi:hypothetical protein
MARYNDKNEGEKEKLYLHIHILFSLGGAGDSPPPLWWSYLCGEIFSRLCYDYKV